MSRRVVIAAALLAAATVASVAAIGASGRAALVAHPRIWLDSSTLTTLRSRATANTAEWQALKADCDKFLLGPVDYPDGNDYPDSGIGEGYQGSGYFEAVLDLGLCAQ